MTTDPKAMKTVDECIAWLHTLDIPADDNRTRAWATDYMCRVDVLEAENTALREKMAELCGAVNAYIAPSWVSVICSNFPDAKSSWKKSWRPIKSACARALGGHNEDR
jgi:hypothetical protein